MAINLEHVSRQGDAAEEVLMNAVVYVEWGSGKRYLYTQALNSCTAVAVTSERAAILAHIAPSGQNTIGDQNVVHRMQEVIDLYGNARKKGMFPGPSSIVLAAIYDGAIALPHQIDVIKKVLGKLRLAFTYREYNVRNENEDRRDGETSMIIHCTPGARPHLYVNDQLCTTEPEDSTESSKAQVSSDSALRGQASRYPSTEDWNRHAAERINSARAALHRMIAQGTRRADALALVRGLLAGELHISQEQAGQHLLSSVAQEQGEQRGQRSEQEEQVERRGSAARESGPQGTSGSTGRAEWNKYATSMVQDARAARDRLIMQGLPTAAANARVQPVLAQQLYITEAQAGAYLI